MREGAVAYDSELDCRRQRTEPLIDSDIDTLPFATRSPDKHIVSASLIASSWLI